MNRQNPDQMNPLRTNPVRTWGYPCSYFPYFSTYSTSCIVSSDHVGYSLISWISGIALGIEGYRFGHRYGDQKMCDLRCMFQVTRNSDKLHVAILLLDSGFGEASVTAQGCFSTYLSTVTIWINIITITIIISIITTIKLMMRYELVSCIPYRSTYPNISILFNVTISYILDDRPSCNYPGRPAHCDCSSVALWHQKIGKSCAQQDASIINKV